MSKLSKEDLALLVNPNTEKIFTILDNKVRFIGGCVRNILMGHTIKDIDLATSLKPEQVIESLTAKGIKVKPTGIKFGTVTAIIDKTPYEITTLRRDIECYGRDAKVDYTQSWEADSTRRDFTINAISVDFEGNIYDYHNGLDDIKNHLIKFVGNPVDRCREDVLRILRYFRFLTYYGKENVDKLSLDACVKVASKIVDLSGERINQEIIKLLSAPDPVFALNLIAENKLDKYIFLKKINLSFLDRIIKQEEKLSIIINPIVRLSSIIVASKFTKEDVNSLIKYWKLSNKDKKSLLYLFNNYEDISGVDEKLIKKIVRKEGNDNCYNMVSFLISKNVIIDARLLSLSESWQAPEFPISGQDLKAMGIKPGKEMGELLESAAIWWEDEDYKPSKEEIINFISKSLKG